MKHVIKSSLVASILVLTATAANAQQQRPKVNLNKAPVKSVASPGLSYSYAGARYISQKLDEYKCTQDGLNIYGSFDIRDGFFAKAAFSDVNGGVCGSSSFYAGGGYRTAFSQRTDMYVTVGFNSVSIDKGGSDSGLELAAGLRTYLQSQLEGSVELFHNTADSAETGIRGGLVYWFNRRISITGDLAFSADSTTIGFGGRLAF